MRKRMRRTAVAAVAWMTTAVALAADVVWFDGRHPVSYTVQGRVDAVVRTALAMFAADMRQVTGLAATASRHGTILIRQGSGTDDGFRIHTSHGQIVIDGHNGRGTAYGILELSRMAGVSPWVWWGDVVPERRERLTIDEHFDTEQTPSVEYRGIFLNDEDWSLRPWNDATHNQTPGGYIGADTYRRIFQLLLRLRANAIWPAMHPGSVAFFKIEGAKAVADSCGIVVGSSHCEPLLRNNVGEWDVAGRGRFNYKTNRQAVHDYWIERLKEVRGSHDNMFTIGMRGIHDSSMEGYTTEQEKLEGLQQVIDDQQQLLDRYIGRPDRLMQVFVPYKEVLQLYEMGLKVPDYVTLMWCDDNYGYMTRLSDAGELRRLGGAGVYYHLSYWGRPHDYLWLTTTQPGLIFNEMRQAYDHNARRLWIANVHDPKVAGYDLELFLDMAWNIDAVTGQTLCDHYRAWLCRQFGSLTGERLFPVMHEFYRLCGERRPEFMGWSQVELDKRVYDRGLGPVRNTDLSTTAFGGEMDRYLERYAAIASEVEAIRTTIRPALRPAYFAAIEYPVAAAQAHAEKLLEAQRARQLANGSTAGERSGSEAAIRLAVARSQAAYQRVRQLTRRYNQLSGGKWHCSMCDHPRDLPVFWAPLTPVQLTDSEVAQILAAAAGERQAHPLVADEGVVARNACDYDAASPSVQTVQMLGHSMNAVALPKGATLTYHFDVAAEGTYQLITALIPTQPNDNGDVRYSVVVDGGEEVVYSLKEPFRSEQWKQNVLRGQALRRQNVTLGQGRHTLVLKALDDHIVIDQWMIDPQPGRAFYLLPVWTVRDSNPC